MTTNSPKPLLQESLTPKLSQDKNFSNNLNQTNVQAKSVDTSYLYTPTQYLISNFLTIKKQVEDDLIQTLKSITQIKNQPQTTVTQLKEQLSLRKKQLQGIKRTLNKSCQQQIQVYDIMKKRIHRHQPETKMNNHKREKCHQNKTKVETSSQQETQTKLKQNPNHKNALNPVKTQQTSKNYDQMFDLKLNKEITYFMVDESVKMQQIIQVQEQKKAKKAAQERKLQEQNQKLSQNQQPKYKISIDDPNQPIIICEDDVLLNQMQMLEHEMRMIPDDEEFEINMDDDLMDLERFFSQNYQASIYNFGGNKNNQQREKSKQRGEYQKLPSQNELWISQKDLFKESQFVTKLKNKANSFDQSTQMDLEEPIITQQQHLKHEIKNKNHYDSFFQVPILYTQGQLELQCMLYRKKHQISRDILSNSLESINKFLYQNSHMIKKYDSDLEFWVIICRAIDLIDSKNQKKQMQAIELIRSKLLKMKGCIKDWQKIQLQKVTSKHFFTLDMLLMGNSDIFARKYLEKTEVAFRQVFQQIYRLPDFNKFLHSLYTGALILKTPTCVQKEKENPLICPLCNPLAQKLFRGIPLLTRNQSNLICRINGTLMDHENYPVMLPSNQIYSLRGLQESKKVIKASLGKQIEQYFCKFTSTWYNKDQAKKVYLA